MRKGGPPVFVAGLNRYAYVENGPTNVGDALGLCPLDDPCQVPPHPFWASVDLNILETAQGGPFFWLAMVGYPHAPWDYNKQGPYDNFGNFNYGATGAALGLPDQVIKRGAGAYKYVYDLVHDKPDPDGSPLGPYPYGNSQGKQDEVQAGIDYFKHGCMFLHLTFLP
jgi:hypothetical protein